MRLRVLSSLLAGCVLASALPAQGMGAISPPEVPPGARAQVFSPPIDALSVGVHAQEMALEVRGFDTRWGEWQRLEIANEQDPLIHESNLVIFDHAVSRIQIRGTPLAYDVHPIRVSTAPAHYAVAALGRVSPPRILSREEWGADELLRVAGHVSSSASSVSSSSASVSSAASSDNTETKGDVAQPSSRVQDCLDAQAKYSYEFRTTGHVVAQNDQGQPLLWPEAYSPAVRMLVVHHTAVLVGNDPRPAVERMRAIYQYHAVSRGWGDIGYHYVIDEKGQIYEGRAGGDYVVGGHAYCNNVGSVGVALMGNFDLETPPQAQVHSLQWLLSRLVQKYQIDLQRNVIFHGKVLEPIIGHRQVTSTECPGAQMWAGLDQVRAHVRDGAIDADVSFPTLTVPQPLSTPSGLAQGRSSSSSSTRRAVRSDGLGPLGSTTIEGRPGGQLIIPFLYQADRLITKGARIASISRANPRLLVWQEKGASYERVRQITAPSLVGKGQSVVVKLKIQLPADRGTFALHVGSIAYSIESSGKRVRGVQMTSSYQTYANETVSALIPKAYATPPDESGSAEPAAPAQPSIQNPLIRIRLHDDAAPESVTVAGTGLSANGASAAGSVSLRKAGDRCTWEGADTTGIVRLQATSGVLTLTSWQKPQNKFRGTIECRVLDGELVLINELPLEDYLAGLAEEPDTQLYEKQRAFAIAARTYAAYYLDPAQRKFPGLPYDGSDSPAEFQVYGGVVFEQGNPRWLRATRTTAAQVLTVNGDAIKPPYFSSDDGRTRSPAEAGWSDFPHAEVFASKPDPWCQGMELRGHGVGMSGCGATGQAQQGKTAEQILSYYYPGAAIVRRNN